MATVLGISQPYWTIAGLCLDIIACGLVANNWRKTIRKLTLDRLISKLRADEAEIDRLSKAWQPPPFKSERRPSEDPFDIMERWVLGTIAVPFPGLTLARSYLVPLPPSKVDRKVITRVVRNLSKAGLKSSELSPRKSDEAPTPVLKRTNPYAALSPIIANAIVAVENEWAEKKGVIDWNPLGLYLGMLALGFGLQIVGTIPIN